jgi:hypothetical protein
MRAAAHHHAHRSKWTGVHRSKYQSFLNLREAVLKMKEKEKDNSNNNNNNNNNNNSNIIIIIIIII